MTLDARALQGSAARRGVLLLVGALLFALLPLAGEANAAHLTPFPGEPGDYVEHSGDGLLPTYRYRGLNRFDTARLIAADPDPEIAGTPPESNTGQAAFFRDSDEVLIARGDLFPDALAGNYLAGVEDAPILLTPTNSLDQATIEALELIDPETVTVLGGTQAISEDVFDDLSDDFDNVRRIGGFDRYETAILLAETGGVYGGDPETRTAIVAYGDNFPDALVTGAISFDQNWPLLLSTQASLEPKTEQALIDLEIDHVIIPGGTVALSDQVEQDIRDLGIEVTRLREPGGDRVTTAIAVATYAQDNLGWGEQHLNFSRGDQFPDALTIGPHAGAERSPLLLTATATQLDGPANPVEAFMGDQACALNFVHLAGGFEAITPEVEEEIRTAATASGEACNLELTPESATNLVGESHTVTATVTDNGGTPVESSTVLFEVYDEFMVSETQTARFLFESATVLTDESGTARFTYSEVAQGRDFIAACVVPEGESCTTDDDPDMSGLGMELRDDVPAIDSATKDWGADFAGTLFGQNEVDENGEPVPADPNAFGVAYGSGTDDGRFCYGAFAVGLSAPPVAFHVHEGTADTAGPVVIPLDAPTDSMTFPDPETGEDVTFNFVTGCVEDVDQDLLDDIADNPLEYYFNIHTEEFPAGAIRGQLLPSAAEFAMLDRFALLTGAAEVPGPGDLDGTGFSAVGLFADDDTELLCFELFVEGIELPATGAHIHEGGPEEAGPIVVGLTAPVDPFGAGVGFSFGCVDELALTGDASEDQFSEIIDNPEDYYVNVHNEEFPAGAVRGQLSDELPELPEPPAKALGRTSGRSTFGSWSDAIR